GFSSHSRPIVVSSVCPGKTRVSGGSAIRTSITDPRTASKSSRVPPTASLNSVSPLKQSSPFTTNDRPSSLWPGAPPPSTPRPASRAAGLEGARHARDAELALVLDVVAVTVGAEDCDRLRSPALHGFEQRLHRRTAVDEDGGSALLVRDDVRIREVSGMHAPL